MPAVRVLVVDDSPAFRAAAASFLGLDERIDIVADVASAAAAFEVLAHQPIDLVLLDVTMPDRSGPAAAREMAATYPKLLLVLCSTMPEPPPDDLRIGEETLVFIPKEELLPDLLIQQWERHRH